MNLRETKRREEEVKKVSSTKKSGCGNHLF